MEREDDDDDDDNGGGGGGGNNDDDIVVSMVVVIATIFMHKYMCVSETMAQDWPFGSSIIFIFMPLHGFFHNSTLLCLSLSSFLFSLSRLYFYFFAFSEQQHFTHALLSFPNLQWTSKLMAFCDIPTP